MIDPKAMGEVFEKYTDITLDVVKEFFDEANSTVAANTYSTYLSTASQKPQFSSGRIQDGDLSDHDFTAYLRFVELAVFAFDLAFATNASWAKMARTHLRPHADYLEEVMGVAREPALRGIINKIKEERAAE